MNFDDLFKPYSPEIRGDLEKYLKEHDGSSASNLFYGFEYFFAIKDKGLMNPGATFLRVNQSPAPDIGYFVNSDYLLESRGSGQYNMSFMTAKKGIYDPKETLKNKSWSIFGLKN